MDREKVIKGLEICTKDIPMSNAVHKSDFCKECPYYNAENRYCWNQIVMMRDALALLKEQEDALEQMRLDNTDLRNCNAELLKEHEAVEPEVDYICGNIVNVCGKCKSNLIARVNFCPWCGQKVKWE